jgi:hypothetical protein
MNKVLIIMLSLFVLLSIACTKSAPKCGDVETKNLVIQLLRDNKFSSNQIADFDLTLDNIRTTSFDKDTGKYSCEADLNVVMTSKTGKTVNKFNKDIFFTSEITSDNKHYVSVDSL